MGHRCLRHIDRKEPPMSTESDRVYDEVREYYAAAARTASSGAAACCGPDQSGFGLATTTISGIFPRPPRWRASGAGIRSPSPTSTRARPCSISARAAVSTCCCRPQRVGPTGFAYGLDMTRRDARPRPPQRRRRRRHQRRVPRRPDGGDPAARRIDRCRHLQLRGQPVARQARRLRRDPIACFAPVAGSASATSSPRIASPTPSGSSAAPTSAASPAPSP